MTDLREGRIQAFLDLEMAPEGRRQFTRDMASDPTLAAAVDAQRDRIQSVKTALDGAFGGDFDLGSAEIANAWTAVAGRTGVAVEGSALADLQAVDLESEEARDPEPVTAEALTLRTRVRRRGTFSKPAAKAAGLLLVAAGAAAAAIPGSPLRNWVETLSTQPAEVTVAPPVAASTGVSVPVSQEALLVVLPQTLASERLVVSVVDGDMVEVLAGPNTRFSTSQGRIELAEVTGPVTVLIPEAQAVATVEVGGMVYLRKSGERVEVLQEADSLASEFVFGQRESGEPNEAPSR